MTRKEACLLLTSLALSPGFSGQLFCTLIKTLVFKKRCAPQQKEPNLWVFNCHTNNYIKNWKQFHPALGMEMTVIIRHYVTKFWLYPDDFTQWSDITFTHLWCDVQHFTTTFWLLPPEQLSINKSCLECWAIIKS